VLADQGGGDGCMARAELADLYLSRGDVERMIAEIDQLARDPELDMGHCELVADMLAEHGDLRAAARWYDRAVARMSADTVAELGTEGMGLEVGLLRRRRNVRVRLGLDPDTLDGVAAEPGRAQYPGRTQFLMFQRDELPEAQRRWPSVFDEVPEEYYARGERVYHDYRDGGLAAIRLVPAKAADLAAFAARVGESAEDGGLRARFAASADPATTLAWPPERNAGCWCGSGRKYKKCCGRPQP
jgi:hypothetical protein